MGVPNIHHRCELQTHEYVTACYGKMFWKSGWAILPEQLLRHSGNFKSDKIYRNVDCWVVQLTLGLTEVN